MTAQTSDSTVFSEAVFNGELYASGDWQTAGGITAPGIARWNGSRWADVGGGFPSGGVAYAMLAFDDASGPALFATGPLVNAGGNPVSHIAKWDGSSWSNVGGGLTGGSAGPQGYSLAVYDSGSGPGLYVGGNFAAAAGVPAANIARWGLRECPANCDGSTNAAHCPTLNVNDFVCYMGRFAAGDQRANCDGSSLAPTLNVNDFMCFLTRFAAGCG